MQTIKTNIRIYQQWQRANIRNATNISQYIIKGRNTEIRQPQRARSDATAGEINRLIPGALSQQSVVGIDGANDL